MRAIYSEEESLNFKINHTTVAIARRHDLLVGEKRERKWQRVGDGEVPHIV